ncbi:MAG TPA: NUDIX hydrolase [Aquabacterium sp.]|nr:NUDIX hydrolase [Aquabacterium sp.]
MAAEEWGTDSHLRESLVSSQTVYQGHFLTLKRDMVALPDGKHAAREYVVHPGAVMIIAVLPDDRLVMERQYRYPVGQTMLEFPAGKLDAGEGGQACAQRELLEETGYRAKRWAKAGLLHPCIGYATEVIEIWFADELSQGERHLDEGEFLDVFAASQQELEAAFDRGDLTDGKTITGLMWLQRWRSGLCKLDWQEPI